MKQSVCGSEHDENPTDVLSGCSSARFAPITERFDCVGTSVYLRPMLDAYALLRIVTCMHYCYSYSSCSSKRVDVLFGNYRSGTIALCEKCFQVDVDTEGILFLK